MSLIKNLGSLQQRALHFLAENPNNHKQRIQQGIRYPPEQYTSVLRAVNALEKMGYIESEEGLSGRKVKIRFYSCTEKGVFYALAKTPYINILKILHSYKEKYPVFDFFIKEHNRMDRDSFMKFFGCMIQSLQLVEKSRLEAHNHVFRLIVTNSTTLSPDEHNQIMLDLFECFPESKKVLKNIQNQIDMLIQCLRKSGIIIDEEKI